jgi:hypothetical protein
VEDFRGREKYKMSLDIIGPETIEELKLETEDLREKKKSKEWKLLLKFFRKLGWFPNIE